MPTKQSKGVPAKAKSKTRPTSPPKKKNASRRTTLRLIATSPSAIKLAMENAPDARTVVYIHGIGNKPVASVLKCQWDRALFGVDLGERSRMAYWVNRAFYPDPLETRCGDGDFSDDNEDQSGAKSIS